MAGRVRRTLSSRPAMVGAGFAAGVALLGGGYAWGSIPAGNGVISGCYTNGSPHVLRVIDTAKVSKCPTGTTALAWNQTGPQGVPGMPAPTNLYWFASGSTSGNAVNTANLAVPCPAGYRVVGGGYNVSGTDQLRMQVVDSHRQQNGTGPESWYVAVVSRDQQPATFTIEVQAYCVSSLPLGAG